MVAGGVTPGLVDAVAWLGLHLRPHMPVIFVPGPHDYYGTVLPIERVRARRAAAFADVHLLDGAECGITGVRFVGCTLWSDFLLLGEERRRAAMHATLFESRWWIMTGPNLRWRLRPEAAADMHAWDLAGLERRLARPHPGPTVVVTHHAPSALSLPPSARNDAASGAIASDLSALIGRASPDLWVHGAVPEPVDYRLGRTRILANPRRSGTERFSGAFDPALVVEV